MPDNQPTIEPVKIAAADQRLQHAADQDGDVARYALGGVHFDNVFACATDGHILAIRRRSTTMARETTLRFSEPEQTSGTYWQVKDSKLLSEDGQRATVLVGRFPNPETVLRPAIDRPIVARFRLDAGLLHRLAKAITPDPDNMHVVVEVLKDDSGLSPLVVRSADPDGDAVGLIMPLKHVGHENEKSPVDMVRNLIALDSNRGCE